MLKLYAHRVLAVAAAFMAAQFMAAQSAVAADLQIGGLFPLSGSNAEYGEIYSGATNLAVEHVNQDRLLSGRLSVVYEDSQALPLQGVNGMNKLANVQAIPYVLTGFTGVSKAIAPIAARTKTVAVNGGGVGPDLAKLGPYFWNVIPLATDELRALVPYLVKERGLKRVALIYVDDPLGQSIKAELEAALPAAGGTLVESLSIPASAQQFSSVAARVRDAKPEAVYIASFGAQQAQLVKQLRDNGVTEQIASYSAFSVPSLQNLPEAKGALYTSQRIDTAKSDKLTTRFLQEYKAKYGKTPGHFAINYYNAAYLFGTLASALEKKGQSVTGENLLAQRRETKTFEFVGASVTFNEDGTINAPMEVKEIDGGDGKVVHRAQTQ